MSADHNIAAVLTDGHRPTLGVSGIGIGWVGCECMTVREWHGYLTQHGGPPWEAWLQHVLAAQPPQEGREVCSTHEVPQPDEQEVMAVIVWKEAAVTPDVAERVADRLLAAGFRREAKP